MDDQNPSSSSSKADRKNIEENRRNQMKALYSKLGSLVPHQSPTVEIVCLSDQLEGAANYIRKLQTRLDLMKQKKRLLMIKGKSTNFSSSFSRDSTAGGLKLPRIDFDLNGSALDVVLITGLNYQFMFAETVRILNEEGADVVSASFSVVDHTVFHTVHTKIEGCGLQYEAARISERLRKLVTDDNY